LGLLVQNGDVTYDVYFYNEAMNKPNWFEKNLSKADVVLDAKLSNPLEYFDK
jgi:hypothetical protein